MLYIFYETQPSWILVIDDISAHTYFLKRFIFIE